MAGDLHGSRRDNEAEAGTGVVVATRLRPALGIACLALASSCAGPGAEPGGEVPGELTLTFAWPSDLRADVEVKRLRVREGERGTSSRAIEARYRLRTEPRPDSLRVVSEDLRVTSIDGRVASESLRDASEGADAAVAAFAPTLRVDAEGHVLEVEGLAALRRRTAEQIAQASPRAASQAAQIAEMAITPATLSEHWGAAVESWVGLEVEPGARYDMEVNDARPGTLEVSERVACFPGDEGTGCLRLVLESWLDAEHDAAQQEIQSAARELVGQLGAGELPADAALSVEMREEVELVTEPERLVPHFVRVRRERRIEAEHAGERRSALRIDETEHRYRY
jgi:hypothetical protein